MAAFQNPSSPVVIQSEADGTLIIPDPVPSVLACVDCVAAGAERHFSGYTRVASLVDHRIFGHHFPASRVFPCGGCGKRFARDSKRNEHNVRCGGPAAPLRGPSRLRAAPTEVEFDYPAITLAPDFERTKPCTVILSWPPLKLKCTLNNCSFFSIAEKTTARTSLEHHLFKKHGGAIAKFRWKCRLCPPELAPMSGHAARDHHCVGKTTNGSINSEVSNNESTPLRQVIRETHIRLLRLSAGTLARYGYGSGLGARAAPSETALEEADEVTPIARPRRRQVRRLVSSSESESTAEELAATSPVPTPSPNNSGTNNLNTAPNNRVVFLSPDTSPSDGSFHSPSVLEPVEGNGIGGWEPLTPRRQSTPAPPSISGGNLRSRDACLGQISS